MESTKDILLDTPFRYPCNIYKESAIPILKDHHVSDQCKEIGRHLLNMTKNPLSQHVDVLIPKSDKSIKPQLEHFKSFFGHKYTTTEKSNKASNKQVSMQKKSVISKNAYLFESAVTKPIKEFIDTEQSYVELLEEIMFKVMKPIKESIANEHKTPILDQYSFNRIFINMEDILEVNKSLLDSLHQYQQGITTESFGQILLKHVKAFDCYRVFFLGKTNSLSCHTQNIKQNKNYSKFLLNTEIKGNLGMSDILISPIQRMARYKLLVGVITSALDPNDIEIEYLKQVEDKVSNINDMQYGDSSLLNLYHLIREAPASLIQTRQLLGYFDATELSLLSGKSNRPVTILVFTDKLMVVKRKNYNLQGKDVLHKIEEKVKNTTTTSMLQKAKEAYTGLPLEFKGWVDIKAVEMFHGLKDRPDTFFLRTTLPELDPNATEKETEDYFRRSDRLYSIIPNTTTTKHQSLACFIEKKNEFIALCQKQFAVAKLKDTTNELYYEDKFKLPAYTHFYDEESYHQMEHKNHILVVYVDYSSTMIDLNKLITDDVWIVILLTRHKSGGYKPTIRARTSLIPIREINRDMEYEHIVNDQCQKDSNMPLDFIDTLWNNLFFYERRLRATEAFSCVNDDLLRARARSRSRSKSLTRVASNMSIGKLFARSRSSSPSRHSALDQQEDDILDQATHVPDPVFKVATINKQLEEEFRSQNMADMRGPKSSRISTQPHTRGGSLPSEIFVRDDIQFIDAFNEKKTTPEEMLYSGSNIYQDNSFNRPNPYPSTSTSTSSSGRRRGSIHGLFTDVHHFPHYYRHSSSPESISRPSSGGSCSSSSETTPSSDPVHFIRPMNDAMGSYSSSSSRSYFDDHVKTMDFFLPSPHREKYYGSPKSNSPSSCDERLMCTIDGSRRSNYNRRAPLPPNFYNQPQAPMQPTPSRQPGLAHRPHTVPAVNDFVQLKHDVNGMIDELIQSHQQMRLQDPHQYYNSTYETVKGVRSHIVSKLDEIMDDLNHTEQYQYELR